jgi:hypothetical protein
MARSTRQLAGEKKVREKDVWITARREKFKNSPREEDRGRAGLRGTEAEMERVVAEADGQYSRMLVKIPLAGKRMVSLPIKQRDWSTHDKVRT